MGADKWENDENRRRRGKDAKTIESSRNRNIGFDVDVVVK
jgi:hypothetical protein